MKHNDHLTLHRSSSCSSTTRNSIRKLLPTITYTRISSTPDDELSSTPRLFVHQRQQQQQQQQQQQKDSPLFTSFTTKTRNGISSFFRSLLNFITIPAMSIIPTSCKWLTIPTLSITPSLGRKVTGTLFGNRRGHVSFAVQDDPKSAPALIVELSISTSTLVKEMSSGLVRIALECDKLPAAARGGTRQGKLYQEPTWTMYCNGRKSGYAASRACNESDWHVLSTIQTVSAGAGVIPVVEDSRKKSAASEGELLYMRAKFERVVGSRDSEAFYMMNPDGNGGPELSIFLLRL